MSTGAFDWPALMRAGMRPAPTGLGLVPEVFWRLTPAELLLMLGSEGGDAPLNRSRLEELARAYPDTPRERDEQTETNQRRPGQ